MEFLKNQMKIYKENKINYYSINLIVGGYDINYPENIKKQIEAKTMPSYKDIKIKDHYDDKRNCLMIPLGEVYNLILVDVDNKENTINEFNKILIKNNIKKLNTFTEKTLNNGYHYYYRLNEEQKNKLNQLKSLDGKLYNLHIDIKYNNQLSFGSTILQYENIEYKTEIINKSKPDILPDFLFNEIINKIENKDSLYENKVENKVENKKESKKESKKIQETKSNINIDEIKAILDSLPEKYYNDRSLWRNVGYALGSCKNEKLKELYYEFSSKSNKYNGQDECDEIFNNGNGEITINTLYKYANDEKINKNEFIDENENYEYEKYDHYIDFLNNYNKKQIKDMNKFIIELSKYIKFCITKSIYICKISEDNYDFIKSSNFETNLSKYYLICNDYKNGKKILKKEKMNNIIDNNIKYFTIHDIIFKPGEPYNDKYFNLFKGFKVKKIEKYDEKYFELLIKHIKEVWANGNEEIYEYILYWIASIIQNPSQKTNTALVFISKEGAGKNIIFDFLKKYIFSNYAVNVCDLEKITGKFNSMLSNKILTVLNEANQVLNTSYNKTFETLKNLISENKQIVEKKGLDPFEIDDYNNYMFFSNNPNPIKISSNDRRYMISNCSDKYVGNHNYFENLIKSLNEECATHFYTYLLSLDLSKINLKQIPINKCKTEQIINSMSSFNKFLYTNACDIEKNIDDDKYIDINYFYDLYKEKCHQDGFIILNKLTFSKEMHLILDKKVIKIKNDDDKWSSKKVFVYDIKQIKNHFKKMNIELE